MTACQHIRENAMHLMVQTPYTLFAYWDVTPEYLELAKSSLPGEHFGLQIRLVRETAEGAEIADTLSIPSQEIKGRTYFSRQNPYNAYYAELGLSYQGGFFTLLRSAPVITPPAGKATKHLMPKSTTESHRKDTSGSQLVPDSLPFAYSPAENKGSRGD
ncbi:DUF4912 domain-containing protein [Dethiobacter alkaliphilus]|uniref:DUF4912 domain-containing protein n=1 Tax=Dethiobacter alkaliphilus AHT 1 TaxID=555088 RepID=C0GDS4_DETAL|nr:DUF4912 domain-containing protein [Dethiobacter alkaliphilus]EEG78557.1 hypothetical protein DealDRAFT_0487 [Dethiobacter alkaliphilus AHT 1]